MLHEISNKNFANEINANYGTCICTVEPLSNGDILGGGPSLRAVGGLLASHTPQITMKRL